MMQAPMPNIHSQVPPMGNPMHLPRAVAAPRVPPNPLTFLVNQGLQVIPVIQQGGHLLKSLRQTVPAGGNHCKFVASSLAYFL